MHNCKFSLGYKITRDDLLIFRCFECKNNYQKNFNKGLINKFANTYEFCNKDINRFILLLRKGIYTYEYIDSWERFDKTSLSDKEAFYSSLNMLDNTSVDYRHAKRVYKQIRLKILGDYHDLYVQNYTLLAADVFENFKNKCIEIYELDPAHFMSALELAWQVCFKKAEVKLELLTDNKCINKANNKYMKSYDKNIESLCLMY